MSNLILANTVKTALKLFSVFIFLISTLLYACTSENETEPAVILQPTPDSLTLVKIERDKETQAMVTYLANLYKNTAPENNLYLNAQQAALLKNQLNNPDVPYHGQEWYSYCAQLLRAGESRECITELESHFDRSYPLGQQMTPNNYILFELLAIAHLRVGEQENCQNFHNEYSCIIPLQDAAVHQLPSGSTAALNIYQAMYDRQPSETYKWLINLAYMTLGKHPQEVPKQYLIEYPNWKLEQKNFPHFNEVSMNTNTAINGLCGGVCLDDFNNDGLIDLFATDYWMEGQAKLCLNNGAVAFEDRTTAAGLDGIVSGLNCIQADYNNDGFVDVLVLRGAWLGGTGKHPNSLLKNNGDGTFSDVTKSAGGFGHIQKGHGIAFADLDQDGDQDIYAVMGGAFQGDDFTNVLFENPGFENSWLVLDLEGVTSNRDGIGTRIELELNNGQKIYRTVGTGGSFGSSSIQQEIGLGDANLIQKLTLYWQNGETQTFEKIKVNQKLKITEGKTELEAVTYSYQPFANSGGSHQHHH